MSPVLLCCIISISCAEAGTKKETTTSSTGNVETHETLLQQRHSTQSTSGMEHVENAQPASSTRSSVDIETHELPKVADPREDFFGATGFQHVKKHLKTQNQPTSVTKRSASEAKISNINRITAAEIYNFVIRSLNESFRVLNKRCKCYGPDVWLQSLPCDSAEDMVSVRDYRHLISQYSHHVIQRAKYCGCVRTKENASEKAEEKFINSFSKSVLLHDKEDSYVVTKLDFYKSMSSLEQAMKKAVGQCCLRNTGQTDGTDPEISTCHIT
mmetsp:Transcript_19798/g.30996  ORF Transcript_19798/g.30996 Transcript_19798/m.30996 type:complete len:270 (-) Transcript_19798:45-854(-)